MLDPDDFLPAGVHEGYRKNLTELFCGKAGVEKIDSTAMARLPNLEVLWLNDNLLSKLQGLDYNFRLKHLYLHNNSITTLCNASCCITKLRHLETLQLQGNQLQDLKATLEVLSKLVNLRKLGLSNNPLALEGSYREATIFAIPSLEHLDSSGITPIERQAAVKFFTAKRIEKKYAFGTIPKIWDKLEVIRIGEPSVGELDLRKEIRASTRRRHIAAEEKQALELREASRPRFEISYAKGASGLLSAQAGAPLMGGKTFEFVARGRVPHLLVKLGFLRMSASGKRQAAALGEVVTGDAQGAKVHVAVTALGVLPTPLLSRDVKPSELTTDDAAAHLNFEDFLFDPSIYADAYDRVQVLKQMGKADEIYVGVALRESSSNQVIGTARIPLMPLLDEHVEKPYAYDQTPLYPPKGAEGTEPVAFLSLSLTTDWGLSNTCAGEYGNSAFNFVRQRRVEAAVRAQKQAAKAAKASAAKAAKEGEAAAAPVVAVPPPAPPPKAAASKRLARDFVSLKTTTPASSGGAGLAALAAITSTAFKFDAEGYAKYEKQKASLRPIAFKEDVMMPL